MPAANKSKAVDKLAPSNLATGNQLELLGGDVDIEHFHLQIERGAGLDITQSITDAVVDRTIEGASTLTVSVEDTNDRKIFNSGRLVKHTDVNIDGLWWTLVQIKKTGRMLSLVFEEREINLLRRYNKPLFASRNQITRAQFVLRMIREVKEENLRWVIPELNIKQTVSDLQGNQILVGPNGQPTASGTDVQDSTTSARERGKGIPLITGGGAKLTVKGRDHPANREQIRNANIILKTGESMGVSRKILICSIMTAIAESGMINKTGGDRDSVGVFQQRRSQGWPATRNVKTDAAAFFRAAKTIDFNQPHLSYAMLCQSVQHSASSDGSVYAPWQGEASNFLDAFDRQPTSKEASAFATTSSIANSSQLFVRGQITKAKGMSGTYVLTPENSWNCMNRLGQEVNWRAFCVSGVIYFISDHWLFKSEPFMTISEDTDGIDWIDCDYDEGKPRATVTVTAHLSRWSAPPGSTVNLEDMGPLDGKWLVDDVSRSLFNTIGTITLIKPLPLLPEPQALSGIPKGFGGSTGNPPKVGGGSNGKNTNIQNKVVDYARKQLGVPYLWGGDTPGVDFDCSGLTMAAYSSVGISLPHNAYLQYEQGPKLSKIATLAPGDLVFFSSNGTEKGIEHVGIYIGDGQMIDAPHTGANVRIDKNFQSWNNPSYFGATRPWAKN
jgi:hypothetical protein